LKLVVISDTHEQEHKLAPLPDGDVLIHCGDSTYRGDIGKFSKFVKWFASQSHTYKACVMGNHELGFQTSKNAICRQILKENNIIYLEDSGITIDGINFWGSPFQPNFYNWEFNLARGTDLQEKWALIPDDTHVLITHGPPYGIGDGVPECGAISHVGDEDLLNRIYELKHLKAHCAGHLHECYGLIELDGIKFVNASICDGSYRPINLPIVIDV
jgi:Icc-related predicted phosphoesterase